MESNQQNNRDHLDKYNSSFGIGQVTGGEVNAKNIVGTLIYQNHTDSNTQHTSQLMKRRKFLTLASVSALITGGVLIEPMERRSEKMRNAKGSRLDLVLKDQNPTSLRELISHFHKANTPDLMQRYVMGFTPIVIAASAEDPDSRYSRLKEAKTLCDEMYINADVNRHRIKAVPACLSAHLIPFMEEYDLMYAGDLIVEAMGFPQREIQEMVSQNLTSTLIKDEYSWNHFWVPDKVIDSMAFHLSRRYSNPTLCPSANLIIQFIKYYQISLYSRNLSQSLAKTRKRQNELIEKIFKEIKEAKNEYSWFCIQWLDALQEVGKYAQKSSKGIRYKALPPQTSELILGWRNCYQKNDWNTTIASGIINSVLLLKLTKDLIHGRGNTDWYQQEYGTQEANLTIEKLEESFQQLSFHTSIFTEALKRTEGSTQSTLQEIARNTAGKEKYSIEWHNTLSLVPFRDHINPLEPPVKASDTELDYLWHLVSGTASLTGGLLGLIISISEEYWNKIASRTPREIEKHARPTPNELEGKISVIFDSRQ
ncbi:MAG: hypothetical protein F6J96_21115 [Symploca sp. SIO1C2]|nr:hypothetical protein [Symploca sp. SIO1C2]